MWYARNGFPPGPGAYTTPRAVRDGTPAARAIAAPSIAYSVQSPESVLATLSAVAIACENSNAFMFAFTHRSTATAFSQAVAVAGSPAIAFAACAFTSALSQLMK